MKSNPNCTVNIIKNFYKDFSIFYEVIEEKEIGLFDVHSRETGSIMLISCKWKLDDLDTILEYIKDLMLLSGY